MRNRQFQFFFFIALGVFCAALSGLKVGAQQPGGQAATQDGPVAITPKTTIEKGQPDIVITPEDFGNFRFPLNNN